MLRAWKAEQEAQACETLAPDDIEAIEQTNDIITAETVNLGGEGGAAPSAGGGGGAAIGSNSRGGRGGDGGRIFKDGRLADASALKSWTEIMGGVPGSSASDKCTNQNKYVLLCRSHPHRTFAAISRIAMAKFTPCGQDVWKMSVGNRC